MRLHRGAVPAWLGAPRPRHGSPGWQAGRHRHPPRPRLALWPAPAQTAARSRLAPAHRTGRPPARHALRPAGTTHSPRPPAPGSNGNWCPAHSAGPPSRDERPCSCECRRPGSHKSTASDPRSAAARCGGRGRPCGRSDQRCGIAEARCPETRRAWPPGTGPAHADAGSRHAGQTRPHPGGATCRQNQRCRPAASDAPGAAPRARPHAGERACAHRAVAASRPAIAQKLQSPQAARCREPTPCAPPANPPDSGDDAPHPSAQAHPPACHRPTPPDWPATSGSWPV